MTDLKVIQGRRNPTEDPPMRTRRTRFCMHRHIELDHDARRVYCRDCKSEVDAFSYLEHLARNFDSFTSRWRAARRAAEEAETNLAELQRRERNAKQRG